MRRLSKFLPMKNVKNILIVSGHWEERQFTVGCQEKGTKLLYDYCGFPKEAYAPFLTFPASTDLVLAKKVQFLLTTAGIPCGKNDRGFDHGVFVPLKAAFPEAHIPIVQLSMKSNLNNEDHIRVGEVLAPLRSEGTLIICSGQVTHNTGAFRQRLLGSGNTSSDPLTVEFMTWIRTTLEGTTAENYEQTRAMFVDVANLAPHFEHAHPSTDHFAPMFVALGAANPNVGVDNDVCEELSVQSLFHEVQLGMMGVEHYIFN